MINHGYVIWLSRNGCKLHAKVLFYEAFYSVSHSIYIKRDFFKHRTVKSNDKIQRFGVVITPLSRKKIYQIMQITAFKAILARRINIQGCEDYENTFARMESDCTLRFGFIK